MAQQKIKIKVKNSCRNKKAILKRKAGWIENWDSIVLQEKKRTTPRTDNRIAADSYNLFLITIYFHPIQLQLMWYGDWQQMMILLLLLIVLTGSSSQAL